MERDADQKTQRNREKEESKIAKPHRNPFVRQCCPHQEVLAPPKNLLEGRNSGLVPDALNQNLYF